MNRRLGRRAVVIACFVLLVAAIGPDRMQELWQRYQEGQYTEVLQESRKLLEDDPDHLELNLVAGRSLVDTGANAEALPYLEKTVELDKTGSWRQAWALVYLGRASYQLGRDARAREALTKAAELGATKNATRRAQGLLRLLGLGTFYDGWATYETDHFVFRFSPQLRSLDAVRFAQAREAPFDDIAAFFDALMPRKLRFIVWGSREEARQAGFPNLGFARPSFILVHSRADQTVGHEITHVISHYGVEPVKKTGLINEGTAVYFDQSGRHKLTDAKEQLANAGLDEISISELWEDWRARPEDVTYAVAGAFVEHLIRARGRKKFLALFRDQTLENARGVYGDELDQLVSAFEDRLR